MYSNEQIFVWDFEKLQEILADPQPPKLLEASAILRRLLLDGAQSVVHKVAKPRNFKPKFEMHKSSNIEALHKRFGARLLHHGFDPSPLKSGARTQAVRLDDFLRTPVHYAEGTAITVKQMISYTANVGGGVHLGVPKDKDNAKQIHASASDVLVGGMPYPLKSLQPVAQIVVNALRPLYVQVRSEDHAP